MSSNFMIARFEHLTSQLADLPKYGAEKELAQRLLECIQEGKFSEGDPFLSDQELVSLTGRSRGLIRRSLDRLHESGWIERRVGAGTFIGRRASECKSPINYRTALYESSPSKQVKGEKHFRIGIVGQGTHIWSRKDWCVEFFNSLSDSLVNDPIILDFIGWQGSHTVQIDKSLYFNPPDLLICPGPGIDYLDVINKAKDLEIPMILVGVRNPEFGLPNVYEDGRTAATNAVRYLASLGHTRIAYIQYYSVAGWWAFDRYQGYIDGLHDVGTSSGNEMTFWFDGMSPTINHDELNQRFRSFLAEKQPTALILGCSNVARDLKDVLFQPHWVAAKEGGLSLVLFDNDPLYEILFNCKPTIIPYPLAELGKGISKIAKQILNHEENITLDLKIPACELIPGDTTANVKHVE